MDAIDAETLSKLKEIQEMVKDADPSKTPSRKAMLDALDMVDLSDDVKENLRAMLTGDVPKVFGSFGSGSVLAVLFILIVFSLLVFFGYKLYKSIKDKEKKREEKKKAKQMKKKK